MGPRHIHISASQKVLPVVTADELASPAVRVQLGAAGLVEEVRYGAGSSTIDISAGRVEIVTPNQRPGRVLAIHSCKQFA